MGRLHVSVNRIDTGRARGQKKEASRGNPDLVGKPFREWCLVSKASFDPIARLSSGSLHL